jgi:predicted RecA/RadA family phage recombinase
MAKNFVAGTSRTINLTVGSGVVSGDPVLVGTVTGTALDDADTNNKAVVDVSALATYRHTVRNVTAYATGAESTYAAASEGKRVYYDESSTMPTGVKLSLSPKNASGNDNEIFGKIVGGFSSTSTVATVTDVEILQERG